MFWMLTSVIFLATMTANITTDITGTATYSLDGKHVAVLENSILAKIAKKRYVYL